MLADDWLTGPERALRDTLERERSSLQLLVRSQNQRESASNTTNESSVTGGVQYQLRVQPSPPRAAVNSADSADYNPLRVIRHRLWRVVTRATQMMMMMMMKRKRKRS
jgi:hypothetical protein